MITDVAGVSVGHWSDPAARTGCTVVLFPEGAVASGEVRGGAPATREWELLAPERLVGHIDAVVLAGGSAYGLSACDGAVRWCEERARGFETPAARVPIVVGAALFDLASGDAGVRPGPAAGYEACAAARTGPVASGRVGAGAGAMLAMCRGPGGARPGGIGMATFADGPLTVSSLVVVNAYGDLFEEGDPPPPRDLLAGAPLGDLAHGGGGAGRARLSTTIGVVVTNARLDKTACLLLAQSAHDGLARALEPVHTTFDGDAMVAAATGAESAPLEMVRLLGARAVAGAVRSAAG